MGIFDKLRKGPKVEINGHGKEFSCDSITYSLLPFISDSENSALDYIVKNFGIDSQNVSYFADQFIDCAKANAEIFSKETALKQNDHLVHFFFDLYLSLNSSLLSDDRDLGSAFVDAIHIKFFGPPSHNTITSVLDLWQQPEKCFLSSFFALVNSDDFPRMMASFAHHCVSDENIAASESLYLSKLLFKMLEHFQPAVEKMFKSR